MLEGTENNIFSLLWEIRSIVMQFQPFNMAAVLKKPGKDTIYNL